MRRAAITVVLSLLACSSPEENVRYVADFDTEIAQAARIGDPLILRVHNVEDLVERPSSFPAEDINLLPPGSEWGDGDVRGRPDLTVRLSNFIPPNRILGPDGVGVDIRGLGGDTRGLGVRGNPLVPLDDVLDGLEGASPGPAASRPSSLVPNTARLFVGESEELSLKRFAADVRIDGFRARVVLDLSFENDRAQTLEGTFQLRLPAGASPFRLAFGAAEWRPGLPAGSVPDFPDGPAAAGDPGPAPLKEARMVRREKAARAYTETARRRVDPALLEWAGGGVFSARVFPLEPNRIHQVVIGYDVDLVPVGDDLELRLDLPPGLPERTVSVAVSTDADFETEPAADEERDGVLLYTDPAQTPIRVLLRAPGPTLIEGTDAGAGDFFAASFAPEVPDEPAPGCPTVVFLVDASLSANPDGFDLWRRLLPAILRANRDEIREFAVLFFGIDASWWREGTSANTEADLEALLAAMDEVVPEGATDLGAALRAAAAAPFGGGPRDLFLLSDGAANWGADPPRDLPGRIFAYRTGRPGTDVRTLSWLARESGGAVFTMADTDAVDAAAVAHTKRPWHIRSLTVTGGADVLVDGRPTSVYPGQRLTFAGRGRPVPGAEIRLAIARDGEERLLTAHPRAAIESPLAPRLFGEIATACLEALGAAAEEEAGAVASHFRVVGRSCSLLMLETEEDYRRQGIETRDDAAVARALDVDRRVAALLDDSRNGSEKERTLAWLRSLAELPGVRLELPETVRAFAEGLPEAAFESGPSGTGSRPLSRADVPGPYAGNLAAGRIVHDDVAAEAGRRLDRGEAAMALRALSSLVEASPGDTAVAREVSYFAMEHGLFEPAIHLLRRAALARPFEPETFRTLALCHEAAGRPELARLWFEVALAGQWDQRFGEFRWITAFDAARFFGRIGDGARRAELEAAFGPGQTGLVVVLAWNTDGTDVDLHVTDPRGEECYYLHTKTAIGGSITRDVTAGFGPEMFVLPNPVPGAYRVDVTLYATRRDRVSLRTKVLATVIENAGLPTERVMRRVVTLQEAAEAQPIARIIIE
jgi:hypothetical protein